MSLEERVETEVARSIKWTEKQLYYATESEAWKGRQIETPFNGQNQAQAQIRDSKKQILMDNTRCEKMFIMHCKYDRNVLSRVAFTERFMYNMMLLGRFHEKNVFVQLSQMFAET